MERTTTEGRGRTSVIARWAVRMLIVAVIGSFILSLDSALDGPCQPWGVWHDETSGKCFYYETEYSRFTHNRCARNWREVDCESWEEFGDVFYPPD